MLFCLNR
jgi:hypothetical protein